MKLKLIVIFFDKHLTEQIMITQKHPLIQQIDKWEHDSIEKIRQTAEEARQLLLQHTTEHIQQLKIKLNKLTDQLRESRQENDFFETDLRSIARRTDSIDKRTR